MDPIRDATEVDPVGHRVVFENEHLRVLEVRSPEGTHIPLHSHRPRLLVAINGYRIRSVTTDGDESVIDRRPGEAIWVEHEEHSADILIGPTHVIEVEVKSAR
jgi:hypothetical protein